MGNTHTHAHGPDRFTQVPVTYALNHASDANFALQAETIISDLIDFF